MFHWSEFLDRNQIEYVTSGPNVARGNIAINCPFCQDDPSEHLVISTKGKGWYCRRNKTHSGKSPIRLVQALLRCSVEQARHIVGGVSFLPDNFLDQVKSLTLTQEVSAPNRVLTLPVEFFPIELTWKCRYAVQYLTARGYTEKQIGRLNRDYDLRYCRTGPFAHRIIFPVRFGGKLVTWTGRAVSQRSPIRYKTLSAEDDEALGPITDYLLWWDELIVGGDILVLCEGPFDALRVSVLGKSRGIKSTCFFTSGPGPRQIDLLHELLPKYHRRVLMLDRNTTAEALRIQAMLASLEVEVMDLVSVKDPGDLSATGLFTLLWS